MQIDQFLAWCYSLQYDGFRIKKQELFHQKCLATQTNIEERVFIVVEENQKL